MSELREALADANRIISMMRQHLERDHPECAYSALGVMNDASRAALARPEADGLDEAWAEAETATNGVGVLALRRHMSGTEYRVSWYDPTPTQEPYLMPEVRADTPAAALRALAARLKAEGSGPQTGPTASSMTSEEPGQR